MIFTLRLAICSSLLLFLVSFAGCGNQGRSEGAGMDFPEEAWTYPVSQIFIPRSPANPAEAMVKAEEVQALLLAGAPFADVAREHSANLESREVGGFLGFLRPKGEDRFYGALQAAVPGTPTYPIETKEGIHFLLRHPFIEGRELEAASTVAAYGFFIPWRDHDPKFDRTKEEARALAEGAIEALRKGEMTLLDAALKYAPQQPERPDVFLGRVRGTEATKSLYDRLKAAPEDRYLDTFETPGGFGVLRRGPLFRSIVRHILIQHRDSPERPLSLRRSREDALALATKVLGEADANGTNWSDLVRRFSDDALTAPLDGAMGVLGTGDAEPEIEKVILETQPGHVARALAETPSGFHILYRVN